MCFATSQEQAGTTIQTGCELLLPCIQVLETCLYSILLQRLDLRIEKKNKSKTQHCTKTLTNFPESHCYLKSVRYYYANYTCMISIKTSHKCQLVFINMQYNSHLKTTKSQEWILLGCPLLMRTAVKCPVLCLISQTVKGDNKSSFRQQKDRKNDHFNDSELVLDSSRLCCYSWDLYPAGYSEHRLSGFSKRLC
jgi:hypothetical protein